MPRDILFFVPRADVDGDVVDAVLPGGEPGSSGTFVQRDRGHHRPGRPDHRGQHFQTLICQGRCQGNVQVRF